MLALRTVTYCTENEETPIDARTTRHAGYEVSQRKRKRIEQCFGWGKVIGPMRQVMVQGLAKIDQLMALCDTLDQQIDGSAAKQGEILNAIMAQV